MSHFKQPKIKRESNPQLLALKLANKKSINLIETEYKDYKEYMEEYLIHILQIKSIDLKDLN